MGATANSPCATQLVTARKLKAAMQAVARSVSAQSNLTHVADIVQHHASGLH